MPVVKDLDRHWVEIVKGWHYRPHQVDGHARPFCYVAKLELYLPYVDTPGNLALSPEAGSQLLAERRTEAAEPARTCLVELKRDGFVLWGLYKVCVRDDRAGHRGDDDQARRILRAG